MIWSNYNYIYDSPKHGHLLFNYLTGAFLDISDDDSYHTILQIQKNVNTFDFSKHEELHRFLLDNGIICQSDEFNEDVLYYKNVLAKSQTAYKVLVIVPTLDCNLSCPYCYEGKNKKKQSMSRETIENVKSYINSHIVAENTRYLNLIWYGGEPLLEYNTICEINEHILQMGINYKASIVTNGTLLSQAMINSFDKLNVHRIQLTFDGPKDNHDSKRFFKGGEGTFELLMKKSEMLHKYIEQGGAIDVHIRINVDATNQAECAVLFKELTDSFPRFRVYMAPLRQYHSCVGSINCFSSDTDVLEYMLSLYTEYGIDVVEYNSILKGAIPCMAECRNSTIIGPSGETYLCLNNVGDPKEVTGDIINGETNHYHVSMFRNGRLTVYNQTCIKCRNLWICGGGCPNSQYRNKVYGEKNEVCSPLRQLSVLNRYLDVRYEINKRNNQSANCY